MKREEFERIKEAEKEHLRKMRQLKDAVRQLERQKKIAGAISDMTTSMHDKLDVHSDMIDRLAVDAALSEARLEIALERTEEKDRAEQLEKDEAALAKERARRTVEQIRGDSGTRGTSTDDATKSVGRMDVQRTAPEEPSAPAAAKTPPAATKGDLPEKTIGRMKP